MTKVTIKAVEAGTGADITDEIEVVTVTNKSTGNEIRRRTDGYYHLDPAYKYTVMVYIRTCIFSVDYISLPGDNTDTITIEVTNV